MLPPVQLSAVEMVRWFWERCWIRVCRVFMGFGFWGTPFGVWGYALRRLGVGLVWG